MKNNKAQALVEFVLLLPIILLLIFTSFDIVNLVLVKNDLTNQINDEIKLYEKDKITLKELKKNIDGDVSTNIEDGYLKIEVKKKVSWISPISSLVMKNYTLSIKRVISYE